jgi:hypothetical protein
MAIPHFEYTAMVTSMGRDARQGSNIPVLAFKAGDLLDVSAPAFESDDAETEQDVKEIVRAASFDEQMLILVVPAPSHIAFLSPGMRWDYLRIFANNDSTRVGNVTFSIDLSGLKVQHRTGRLPFGKFHVSRTRYNDYMTRKDPSTNAWFTAWYVTLSVSPA